jgi:phosphatidylserine/phosphatidylglycerophosphate/cardiolipin synthase-like enzyme
MNCWRVSDPIIRQVASWTTSFVATVFNLCTTILKRFVRWVIQSWNQCTSTTSRVCKSLPWPLSALCGWVTFLVCLIVTVLLVIVLWIATVVCLIVTVILALIALVINIIVIVLVWLFCLIVPCSQKMESSTPPDSGWIVTLGGSTQPALSSNNLIKIFPDGMSASQAMLDAINRATIRIHLLELSFEPDFDTAGAGTGTPSDLAAALLAVNQSENATIVGILLNNNVAAHYVSTLTKYFADPNNQPNSVEVVGFHMLPEVMHAKALIIDGSVAFIVGLPLEQGYWDTQQHLVTDARRGAGAGGNAWGLGDVGNGVGKKPVHTVSLALNGQAAADLDATFISLWNSVSTDQIPPPQPAGGDGNQSVQIVRSAPRLKAAGLSSGEMGTLEAYLRAINNATSFIYLEEQYFTSPVIGDALSRALSQTPGLQVILLLNENPDLPTYKWWQDRLVRRVTRIAPGRVGAFALWRIRTIPDQPNEIMQCYVEAKVAVVDDTWATVGSGNLDGASLGHIFELFPSPISCFSSGWRNVELGAVLYDGIAGQPATGAAADIRQVLWQEHLGEPNLPESPPSPGGWLAMWDQIAQDNIASLNSSQVLTGDSRILPYVSGPDPMTQLTYLGVDTSMLTVAPAVPT